ncbi:unnamed protein product [Dicrocoelium dendriticum]|nr:unnamed protein product [Dicrocoelium dendriticum]
MVLLYQVIYSFQSYNRSPLPSFTMAKCGRGIQMTLSWVPERDGRVPPHAVDAGNGVFVCRAMFEGLWIPGKLVAANGKAYIPHGGKEHELKTYEVLCNSERRNEHCFQWEKYRSGEVPKNALVAGTDTDGSPLYVVRGHVDNEVVVGKMNENYGKAYFPHGGEEKEEKHHFELLIWKKS